MLGCQDFCGYYEWTFHYLRRRFGTRALEKYWAEAIAADSQQHYIEAARLEGLRGLYKPWSKTGEDEQCDWTVSFDEANNCLRLDMRHCPSKGFLLENDLNADEDYCDHCMGWISKALEIVGAEVVEHEHNHCGQCWWKIGMKNRPCNQASKETSIQREALWRNGYLHRFESNRPLPNSSDNSCPDSVALIHAAFTGFRKIQIWEADSDPCWIRSLATTSVAVIATDQAYLKLADGKWRPRAVVLGHEPIDLRQITYRWYTTPRELRPLLLHPYLPAAPRIPFPEFGLPRPLPILPVLIRASLYVHEPGGPAPTTIEFANLLKLALERALTTPAH